MPRVRMPTFGPDGSPGAPETRGDGAGPGDGRGALLAALLVVALSALWAVLATPAADRPTVAVAVLIGFLGAAAIVGLAVRRTGGDERLAEGLADLQTQLDQRSRDLELLADETLPGVVALLRDGVSVNEALSGAVVPTGPAGRILRLLAEEVGRGERMRAAAMAACANAAGRVQALATSMLADLRDMEDRHGEEVLGDLLRLDHSTAQAGRLADSIAVLAGARSGRRWTRPIVMESILRGALGRISAYQRVRLHSTSTVAVAGYAAEGVMHALAELMDNATSFSPPSEEVHVYVEEVQAGVVVTIEDGGLVMGLAALRRAERAVSADEPLDLTTLSGTRLGLAVVGVLARKYGLTVSFRPSSRGGTGVVVIIPRELITTPRPADPGEPVTTRPSGRAAGPAEQPRPSEGHGPAERPAGGPPARPAALGRHGTLDPLPKRARGETLAASAQSMAALSAGAAGRGEHGAPSAAVSAGARFGAFQKGGQTARQGTPAAADPTIPAGAAGQADAAGRGDAAAAGDELSR